MAGEQYTVVSGDNLSTIAQRYNVQVGDITGYRSGNPNLIFPGEVLSIGGGGASPAAQPAAQPQTAAEMTPFLSKVQEDEFVRQNQLDFAQLGDIGFDPTQAGEQINQFEQTLTGGAARPEAPKLLDTFNTLREQFGLNQVESDINQLKLQEQNIYARTRARTATEEGKAVAGNVVAGRISEVERQERENLDFVQRNITFLTNQAQSAYGVINQIVQLTQTDFQNASQQYEQMFNQKMGLYKELRQEKIDDRDWKFKLQTQEKETARANLEIYMGMIQKGNLQYSQLDQNTKLAISKMEVQSGLGIGFVSKLRVSPQDQIKSIVERVDPSGRKFADAIIIGDDGQIRVQSTYLGNVALGGSGGGGGSSRPTEADYKQQNQQKLLNAQASMTNQMRSVSGGDGFVAPDSYRAAKNAWVAQGYSAEDFDAQYNNYINPSHWWDYGSRGALSKFFT